jgi:hypothetical protein
LCFGLFELGRGREKREEKRKMDPVSELSQYCQKKKTDYPRSANPIELPGKPIRWEWTFTKGVEGEKRFMFSGQGLTKKEAKKQAAAKMLLALKEQELDTHRTAMQEKLNSIGFGRPTISFNGKILEPLPPWKQDYFDNQYELLETARDVMAIDRAQDKESYRVIQVLTRLIEGEEQMNQNIRLHRTTLEEHLEQPAGKTGFMREVQTQKAE